VIIKKQANTSDFTNAAPVLRASSPPRPLDVAMSFVVAFIRVLLFIWDFVTYPIYLIIDRPWTKTRWEMAASLDAEYVY
jgi:hypothetical protein